MSRDGPQRVIGNGPQAIPYNPSGATGTCRGETPLRVLGIFFPSVMVSRNGLTLTVSPCGYPVIASGAKQSPGHSSRRPRLLRRCAPRNDAGSRGMTWRHGLSESVLPVASAFAKIQGGPSIQVDLARVRFVNFSSFANPEPQKHTEGHGREDQRVRW
jgi:hypothetical protein